MEFDLLHLGDHATTGDECDLTCHTVENMVIKLARVTVERGATMHAESVVMPGAIHLAMHVRTHIAQMLTRRLRQALFSSTAPSSSPTARF